MLNRLLHYSIEISNQIPRTTDANSCSDRGSVVLSGTLSWIPCITGCTNQNFKQVIAPMANGSRRKRIIVHAKP